MDYTSFSSRTLYDIQTNFFPAFELFHSDVLPQKLKMCIKAGEQKHNSVKEVTGLSVHCILVDDVFPKADMLCLVVRIQV